MFFRDIGKVDRVVKGKKMCKENNENTVDERKEPITDHCLRKL